MEGATGRQLGALAISIRETLRHWEEANEALGVPLCLPQGVGIEQLREALAEIEALEGKLGHSVPALLDGQGCDFVALLRQRIPQLRALLLAAPGGADFVRAVPSAPPVDATPEMAVRCGRQALEVWQRFDAATKESGRSPLVLPDGLSAEAFAGQLATAGIDAPGAAASLAEAREIECRARDLATTTRLRLMQYAAAVSFVFDDDHPLARSCPRARLAA